MTHLVVVGVVGFALMFTGALVAARPAAPLVPDSLSDFNGSRAKSNKSKSKASTTFMQRMEARWDDRQDGRL
ncbi:MAG: hypothetical protein JJE28_09595, partial [Actinomycetales bacterium]|nr:hypothetical protein [Actinomycetales bacterium]